MKIFKAVLKKFGEKGEKTGWTYIEVPLEISEDLMPGTKKSFRVKGKLDDFSFDGTALIPMGNGEFIIAINGRFRKGIRKSTGSTVKVSIEVDTNERKLYADFILCLEDDPIALAYFKTLPKSHQSYFSTWIETAKTDTTRSRRIALAVEALALKLRFNEMMQRQKRTKSE
jgi:hypothetical protein